MKLVALGLGMVICLLGLFLISVSMDVLGNGEVLPGEEVYVRLVLMTVFGFLPCLVGGFVLFWAWTRGHSNGSLTRSYFKLLYSPTGRINRRPFWIMLIYINILYLIFDVFGENIDANSVHAGVVGPTSLVILLYALPVALAVQIKRWHDIDRSGIWVLINVVPLIGPLITVILCGFKRGTESTNRFGEDPLCISPRLHKGQE